MITKLKYKYIFIFDDLYCVVKIIIIIKTRDTWSKKR